MRLAILLLVLAVSACGQTNPWRRSNGVISPRNSTDSVTIGATVLPVPVLTTANVYGGTYTSGITATGSAGQTCVLTITGGGGTGATATVALTDTDTIAGSTALVITAAGSGFTSAPTAATAGNGTATCSGTATIATTLSVSPTVSSFIVAPVAVRVVLPAITSSMVGMQVCVRNAPAATGAITVDAPASVYIDKEGTNGSAGGTLASAGAAGDAACFVATSTTQWMSYVSVGTWTAGS